MSTSTSQRAEECGRQLLVSSLIHVCIKYPHSQNVYINSMQSPDWSRTDWAVHIICVRLNSFRWKAGSWAKPKIGGISEIILLDTVAVDKEPRDNFFWFWLLKKSETTFLWQLCFRSAAAQSKLETVNAALRCSTNIQPKKHRIITQGVDLQWVYLQF